MILHTFIYKEDISIKSIQGSILGFRSVGLGFWLLVLRVLPVAGGTGLGLAMWALGVVFTGVSQNFGFLLFARIFTGAGAQKYFCFYHIHPTLHPKAQASCHGRAWHCQCT